MDLREFMAQMKERGWLVTIEDEVDPNLKMARLLSDHDGKPVLFTHVKDTSYPVVAGTCSDRAYFALALGVPPDHLLFALTEALAHPANPPLVDSAPCQEVIKVEVDLTALPILRHLPDDAGPYVTAGVLVIKDPDYGRNVAFHRLLRLDERRFAVRLVEGRGTHTAWHTAQSNLEVAICLGAPVQVLVAAATSPPKGTDELGIAHALAPTPLVKCHTKDLEVPAESEFVLEGRITHQLAAEGPFIDLTETWDIVRRQPVIEIDCITHRRKPIYQALLPGKLEHKLLMGLPREPTIYAAVNEVCDCRNVCLTAGGMYWLHAVVQIVKRHPDDGRRAIEAAFRGHTSLKHVVVVDEDVDLFDPAAVEWAIATRFQASRDLVVLEKQPSSSLDPSATHVPGQKARTSKLGLDATIPWVAPDGHLSSEEERAAFRRVAYE
ncbi:MAG: UbiD family decarboxylase [Chloroflexota bacterium]|nr:UbiD family decarboxylase [Chloroflexota bacterium]